MAIKKYNQFVKTNEEFVDAPSLDTKQAPTRPERGTETLPGRPGTTPSTRPSRPSVVPGKRPSEEDAPLASNDEYIGAKKMKELVDELGPEAKLENGTIYYDGKEINFYSETEKFHIGRKRFDDVKDVLNFLGKKEEVISERDFDEKMDPEFEAKSYRFTRKNKRLK
jgi:hypothetical protein